MAQATLPPQSVTGQQRGLGTAFVDETTDVGGQLVGVEAATPFGFEDRL